MPILANAHLFFFFFFLVRGLARATNTGAWVELCCYRTIETTGLRPTIIAVSTGPIHCAEFYEVTVFHSCVCVMASQNHTYNSVSDVNPLNRPRGKDVNLLCCKFLKGEKHSVSKVIPTKADVDDKIINRTDDLSANDRLKGEGKRKEEEGNEKRKL